MSRNPTITADITSDVAAALNTAPSDVSSDPFQEAVKFLLLNLVRTGDATSSPKAQELFYSLDK